MYYIVTGAAGFIGSNLVKALNERGENSIVAVDHLKYADKFKNLVDCEIADFMDKRDFLEKIQEGFFDGLVTAVLHQGACSDTMETDGRYMMDNNYQYSLELLNYCQNEEIPFLYASSASVYGGGREFRESRECESPLNVYAYSKFLFDQIVRRRWQKRSAQVVGLRYFNVYGPNEAHKGAMASVVWHLTRQLRETGELKLFEGSHGYDDGEQRRDFIHVDDVVAVVLWFLEHPGVSGIFNVGTGKSASFNDLASAVIECLGTGEIRYVPFPSDLEASYQSFTEADLSALRAAGYSAPFDDVRAGVRKYLDAINA